MRHRAIFVALFVLVFMAMSVSGVISETEIPENKTRLAGEWADGERSIYYAYGVTATFSYDIEFAEKPLYAGWLDDSLEILPEHLLRMMDGLLVSFNTGDTCVYEQALGCFTARNFTIYFGVDKIHNETDALALMLHELGHAVDFKLMQEDGRARDFLIDGNSSYLPRTLHNDKRMPTAYSNTSPKEDFAESFFIYIMYPGYLEQRSPARYEFMRDNVFAGVEYPGEFPLTDRMRAKFSSSRSIVR